jgi:hypothetical protein
MHRAERQEPRMAAEARVREDHFHLDGTSYFRGGADLVQLGDAGEKRMPATRPGHLAVQACVPRPWLPIARATRIEIHRTAFGADDIGGRLTVPGLGPIGPDRVACQLKDQTLSLVKLECGPDDLAAAAGETPAVVDTLARAGRAARLVHQVVVVLDMRVALNFTRSTRFEAHGAAEAWSVTGIGIGRTVLPLEAGTTLAYLLLKPAWYADPETNCRHIVGWENDPWTPQ